MKLPVLALIIAVLTMDAAAQSDTEFASATPEPGEGIYSLLRRSGIRPTAAMADEFKTDQHRRAAWQ